MKQVRFIVMIGLVLSAASSALAASSDATGAAAPGSLLEAVLFYIVAGGVVVSALGVCIAQNIVRMAVWLFISLGSVALVYFLLAANFLGAIQLIVYAGGTLILLVFGVMLTSKSPWARFDVSNLELGVATVVCGGLFFTLCTVLGSTVWTGLVDAKTPGTSIADIGRALITEYLVPFEMAGVVLMIVMVGAAHMARQEK